MLRRILILIGLAIAWYFFRHLFRARQQAAPPGGGAVPPPSRAEKMVRDRVCNTYLPRSRALVVRSGDGEHYFCSEECRRKFLEGRKKA